MSFEINNNRRNWENYIWQPLLAVIFVCAVLFFLKQTAHSMILWAVGASSLSSSALIVCSHPSSKTSRAVNIIGGYIIGIFVGELLRTIVVQFEPIVKGFLMDPSYQMLVFAAAIAVGISILLMSLLKVRHPPAAGIALVLVIDIRDYSVLIIIFIAAVVLALLRLLLRKELCDL